MRRFALPLVSCHREGSRQLQMRQSGADRFETDNSALIENSLEGLRTQPSHLRGRRRLPSN